MTKEKKAKQKKSNPNGANEYLLDPRQDKCWGYYLSSDGDTYGNAYRSALKAGYEKSTAIHITTHAWFLERMRRMNLLSKAEKVLEETITMETNTPVIGMFGPILDKEKKPILQQNDKLLKIKQDSAKFVAERLGKKKGYSNRTELTGEDGKDLPTPIYGGLSK